MLTLLKDILQLRVLYEELERVLEKESNDSEVLYITNQLGLGLIDKCLNNTYEDTDLKEPLKTPNRVLKGSNVYRH